MDMVGEALRKNNSLFTMSECPGHLPSFYDGLARRPELRLADQRHRLPQRRAAARYRGQNFPVPMWEKNGSRDAFRFFIHKATGGSDHICFINPAVGVPAIEFFTWPDQWYHTDTDTPDKADPTEMKRVAFIGAATAWAAALCGDDVVARPGRRRRRSSATSGWPSATWPRPWPARRGRRRDARAGRGPGAQPPPLRRPARDRGHPFDRRDLDRLAGGQGRGRPPASGSGSLRRGPRRPGAGLRPRSGPRTWASDSARPSSPIRCAAIEKIVPAIAPAVKGQEFNVGRFEGYVKYMKEHPDALKAVTLARPRPGDASQLRQRTEFDRRYPRLRLGRAGRRHSPLAGVAAYCELLAAAGYLSI